MDSVASRSIGKETWMQTSIAMQYFGCVSGNHRRIEDIREILLPRISQERPLVML